VAVAFARRPEEYTTDHCHSVPGARLMDGSG
jgi:hypothetical protein